MVTIEAFRVIAAIADGDLRLPGDCRRTDNLGVVVGAGLELHLALLKISPEIRYNDWTLRTFDAPGNLLQSNRNQTAILVGISF